MRLASLAICFSTLAACVLPARFGQKPQLPPQTWAQPAPDTVKLGNSAPITGKWEQRGAQLCNVGADVSIATPAGPIKLLRMSGCASGELLAGEAEVPFPALGVLESLGIGAEAPRAKVRVGLGRAMGRLDIGGAPMKLDPSKLYLHIEYMVGAQITVGRAKISTASKSSTIVVSPSEPLIYVEGDIAGALTGGVIDGPAIGISAAGRLPFASNSESFDGRRWTKQKLEGHLLASGELPLHPYPLSVTGKAVLDFDADRDGVLAANENHPDVTVGINGTVSIGYKKAGFGFTLDIGDATVVYDAKGRRMSMSAASVKNPFKGTPLEFLKAAGSISTRAQFKSPTDFEIKFNVESMRVAGMALGKATVTMGSRGISMRAELALPGMGRAMMSGRFDARRGLQLTGRANLRPAGIQLANARVSLGNKGAHVKASVGLPFARVGVSGSVSGRGFSLGGKVSIHLGLVKGVAKVRVSNRGFKALMEGHACLGPACVPVGGMEIDTRGRICPIFPVIGKQCIKIG